MTQDFPGVELDVGGAGDYVAKVDAKIRRIKETYRKVKHGLPWKWPKRFVPDLVGYAVSRLNIQRTQALSGNTCTRVLFTGIPVPYSELSVAFGDYVESYEGTDNTSESRSVACIALCPVGNSTGSWTLWKLSTHMKVRRTNFQKLVTSELVIRAVNALTDEEAEQPVIQSEIVSRQSTDVEPVIERPTEEIESQPEAEEYTETIETAEVEAEAETEQVTQEILEAAPEDVGELRTQSGREVRRPTRFMAVTKVSRSEWGEASCQVAIKLELRQLFNELKALHVVQRAEISRSTKVLQSHMFLVRKYLADGVFDKVKARLVADGRDQDPAMYPNQSSPTVAIHSVFAMLGMASTKPWPVIVKIDVKGAFVQTPMTGEPSYVKIDPKVTRAAVELYPKLAEYVEGNGCLYTLLLKALYGCVQASALWYALIKSACL
jgi:hypothetical protein